MTMIIRLIGLLMGLALALATPATVGAQPSEATPVLAPAPAGALLTQADAQAWLDGLMPTALRLSRVPGAVVVIVKDGVPLLEKGYGVADWDKQTPVDPRTTLFRPGSISKLFAYTAVMQLVEQGKLDLDADVNGYLDFKIPALAGKPLTLRHIMTHTTGFEDTYREMIVFDGRPAELGTWLKRHLPPRRFQAGTTPDYSNYAVSLAGYIVQRVSGTPFDTYIDQHVFVPLGMQHSTFRQPVPAAWRTNLATEYLTRDEKGHGFESINPSPAAALSTTADDMSRFMLAYLQGGQLGDVRILKQETVRLMFDTVTRALPDLNGMGLGFFQQNINGHRVLAHDGDTLYSHSDLTLFVDDHVGIFLSMNANGTDGLATRLRLSLFQEFADRYLPGAASPVPKAAPEIAREHGRLIAGNYASTRGGASNFLSIKAVLAPTSVSANDDGTIQVDLDGVRHVYVETTQPYLWREVGGKDLLQAVVEDGKVVRWSFDAGAYESVYEPVPGLAGTDWMLPLLLAALVVVFLTAVQWPCAALARRYYRAARVPTQADVRSLRGVRVASVLTLLALGVWMGVLAWLFSNFTEIPGTVLLAQTLSLLALAGGVVAALWRALVAARAGHGTTARLVSLLWIASFGLLLWTAVAYHWIGFEPNY